MRPLPHDSGHRQLRDESHMSHDGSQAVLCHTSLLVQHARCCALSRFELNPRANSTTVHSRHTQGAVEPYHLAVCAVAGAM